MPKPAKVAPDPAEIEAEPAQITPKSRAIQAARAQVPDVDIPAILRTDFGLAQRESERLVRRWRRRLEDARVAGKADIQRRLHDAAMDPDARDSTTAAMFLAKRHDAPLGKDLEAERRALEKMSAGEFAAYVVELVSRAGLAFSPRELADAILARAGA